MNPIDNVLAEPLTSADVAPADPPSGREVARVVELAERMRREEAEVAAATRVLRDKLAAYNRTADVELPAAMVEAGVAEWPLRLLDGKPVKLVDKLRAGQITDVGEKPNLEGLAYVRANGGEPLIKTRIEIEAGAGDYARARQLYEELRRRVSNEWKIEFSSTVHPQTLIGWCNELIERGQKVDLECLRVQRQVRAQLGDRTPKTVKLTGLAER